MEEARRAVHVLGIAPHLRADVAAGHGIAPGAADRDDAPVGNRHVEAARVRAVERAGALDVPASFFRGPALGPVGPARDAASTRRGRAHAGAPTMRSTVSTAIG